LKVRNTVFPEIVLAHIAHVMSLSKAWGGMVEKITLIAFYKYCLVGLAFFQPVVPKIMSNSDPYHLERFVEAQAGSYATAWEELRRGRKCSQWMWYVFPQVAGLGRSFQAEKYAIQSRGEAEAYVGHSVLGARSVECAEALLGLEGRTVEAIMGYPDHLKLCSSMTLFAAVSPEGSVFEQVLERYYDGTVDERTLAFLREH
jgi:uncharacterized protein (DUF1810 family)